MKILGFLLAICVLSIQGWGQEAPLPSEAPLPKMIFKAKRHFQDLNKNTVELEGGVSIHYGTSTLTAGHVSLDRNASLFTATENAILTIPSDQTRVKAFKIIYNYQTERGEFINAHVKSGYTQLRGEKIEKIGRHKYILYDGTYSTCDVADDQACPWKIWTSKAKVTMEEYATAEHPVFLVSGFPLMYSPFVVFPVKKERQSGFLMPEFGISEQSGYRLLNSFFLTLGRTKDATFDLEYYSKRGLKQGLEYRQSFAENSDLIFRGHHIRDREFARDFGAQDRYAIDHAHQYYYTPNFFNKALIQLVSDDDYVKDFEYDIKGRQDPGLEAKILQGWNGEDLSTNLEAIYYKSLLNDFPKDYTEETIHKLPELTLDLHPIRFFRELLNFNAKAAYVNFVGEREDFVDKNSNHTFDESIDKLKRVQRLYLAPTLSLPLVYQRYMEWIPSLSYQQTDWWQPAGESHKTRNLVDTNQTVKTNVGHIYAFKSKRIPKMKHLIEPTLGYRYSPLFYVDNNLPGFDGTDTLNPGNSLNYGLDQRLIFKVRDVENKFNYVDGFRFNLSQSYNIADARNNHPTPFSSVTSLLATQISKFSLQSEAVHPVYGQERVERVTTSLGVVDSYNNDYRLNHTFVLEDDHNSMGGIFKLGFIDVLKFYTSFNYSFDEDILLEKVLKTTYFAPSKCWALNMVFQDRVDSGFSFNMSINLLFGEDPLNLANLRQEGDLQRFQLKVEEGERKDLYFEDR